MSSTPPRQLSTGQPQTPTFQLSPAADVQYNSGAVPPSPAGSSTDGHHAYMTTVGLRANQDVSALYLCGDLCSAFLHGIRHSAPRSLQPLDLDACTACTRRIEPRERLHDSSEYRFTEQRAAEKSKGLALVHVSLPHYNALLVTNADD